MEYQNRACGFSLMHVWFTLHVPAGLSCVVISLSLGRNKKECFMEKLSVDGRKVVQADVGNSVDVEMQVLLFTC